MKHSKKRFIISGILFCTTLFSLYSLDQAQQEVLSSKEVRRQQKEQAIEKIKNMTRLEQSGFKKIVEEMAGKEVLGSFLSHIFGGLEWSKHVLQEEDEEALYQKIKPHLKEWIGVSSFFSGDSENKQKAIAQIKSYMLSQGFLPKVVEQMFEEKGLAQVEVSLIARGGEKWYDSIVEGKLPISALYGILHANYSICQTRQEKDQKEKIEQLLEKKKESIVKAYDSIRKIITIATEKEAEVRKTGKGIPPEVTSRYNPQFAALSSRALDVRREAVTLIKKGIEERGAIPRIISSIERLEADAVALQQKAEKSLNTFIEEIGLPVNRQTAAGATKETKKIQHSFNHDRSRHTSADQTQPLAADSTRGEVSSHARRRVVDRGSDVNSKEEELGYQYASIGKKVVGVGVLIALLESLREKSWIRRGAHALWDKGRRMVESFRKGSRAKQVGSPPKEKKSVNKR